MDDVVTFPVSKGTIGMDIFGNCHNHFIDYLACEVRDILVGKANWRTLKLKENCASQEEN